MAVKLSEVRRQIVMSLYDLLLSSDEESYWYSISVVREYIDSEISGAFAQIAINGLIDEKLVERGHDDSYNDIYSLTPKGILIAEGFAADGKRLEDYAIAPSSDLVLHKDTDAEQIKQIKQAIENIRREFTASNTASLLPDSDREILRDELKSAEVITESDGFRLRRLAAFILPALKFMSDKFVGTALGEAAKHLINLLLG